MEFAPEVLDKLADALAKAGYLSTRASIEAVVREIGAQMLADKKSAPEKFSVSKWLRGLSYMANSQIASFSSIPGRKEKAESLRGEDIEYAKRTLLTGSTPGSFLVPTIQADQIIQLLTSANRIREAGARIWPMQGIQKLTVPVATAAPTVVWGNGAGAGTGGQGAVLTPSDPNLSQLSFDLKSAKSLTAIPNELLATSVPAVDQIVSEILGLAFAQAEMNANVATATGTGMPVPLFAAAGTTVISANGGNANGGVVTLNDLLNQLAQFFAQKGKGTPAWFMHPTVFYKDVMGIKDSSGRPIVTGFDSLEGPYQGRLFGYPVFVSAEFPVNQTLGSNTGQSYIAFTNPQYLHIADEGSLELAVSFERFFDANETAIRGVHRVDFGYAPAAAIIIMQGVIV